MSVSVRQGQQGGRRETVLAQATTGWLPKEVGKGNLSYFPDCCATGEGGPQQHTAKGEWASGVSGTEGVKCSICGAEQLI